MTIIEDSTMRDDDELQMTRERRGLWAKTWDERLSLRKLLHRLEDPDVATAIGGADEPDAAPVRIFVDLPTKPSGLRSPLLELQAMDLAARMIERAKTDLVRECRRRGRSWAQIGEALGVTRQSAWMKYAAGED